MVKILALILLTVILAGCCSVPYEQGVPFQNEILAEQLRWNVANLYPSSFRTLHRGALTVDNKQFEMTGYLLVRQPGDIRLVTINDFGGVLFEIVSGKETAGRIIRNNTGISRRRLNVSLPRDIFAVYLKRPSPCAALVRHKGDVVALVGKLRDGSVEEFLFDENTRRLKGYVFSKNACCLYQVTFSDYKLIPDWPTSPLPTNISIKDYRSNYRLELNVLKLTPDRLEDNLFE